jgi:16S rRNA (cytidine1402-2'-O)-methyltransferase
MNKPGKLYLVPTPIGNLEDMTFRAVRILKEADFILAEDTRTSSVLLKHFEIENKLFSHHKFNEHKTVASLSGKILEGNSIALISDAGTPGISDPGFLLVRQCVSEGIEVECLPGPTALIPALVVSGLPCDKFRFEGFLPQKKGRQKILTELAQETITMVFYESPFRVLKSLTQMAEHFGTERACCVCRELSKLYEEVFRGTIMEAIQHFSIKDIKGEIVLVIAGREKKSYEPED